MSKALVIKNADFSTNALTTVTLQQNVPCTGISLRETTKAITSLTAFSLTPTKSPVNTTDSVVWSSSDTSVATVSDGAVTPLKAGTATITASCGSYSATCVVTVRVFLTVPMTYGYYFSTKTSGSGDGAEVNEATSATTYGGSLKTSGTGKYAYESSGLTGGVHAYPIMIPTGATALEVTLPNQGIKASFNWCKSDTASGLGANYVSQVSADAANPWAGTLTAGDRTVSIPSGADCFFLSVYMSGTTITQELLNQITVEALYTEAD